MIFLQSRIHLQNLQKNRPSKIIAYIAIYTVYQEFISIPYDAIISTPLNPTLICTLITIYYAFVMTAYTRRMHTECMQCAFLPVIIICTYVAKQFN